MWSNPLESADLVAFTEEILNGKPHFVWTLRTVTSRVIGASSK